MDSKIETTQKILTKVGVMVRIADKSNLQNIKIIKIPSRLRNKILEKKKDGSIWIDNYKYNTEKDIFEKIGGWLTFLQNILVLIKNLFKKNN